MQTWTNSQPLPRELATPACLPVMRWPVRSKRPSFLMSCGSVRPGSRTRSGRAAPAAPGPASGSGAQLRSTLLTVAAGEIAVSFAICWPVKRWRRSAMILHDDRRAPWACAACVAWRRRPPGPRRLLAWKRSTHFLTVFDVHANAAATALRRLALLAPAAPSRLDCAASCGHSYAGSSGPPRLTEASQLQPSRLGPDGQPIESSHLARRNVTGLGPTSDGPGSTFSGRR